MGEVLRSAAADSAFAQFAGRVQLDERELPMAVGMMALIFDSRAKAEQTFARVAEAAHMRTQMDGASVAVETVTAANGMVSYWGYVQRDDAIVILTLDTLDPHHLSVADLRSLVEVAADRLDGAARRS